MLAGCSAGFLDNSKIKGSHNAMKSGMVAADSIYDYLETGFDTFNDYGIELTNYQTNMNDSKVMKDLHQSRNFKGGFKWGSKIGLIHSGLTTMITKGTEPWNLRNKEKDAHATEKARNHSEIEYPKADGKLTFDLLENLQRSGTFHDHDEPSHLIIKEGLENSNQKSLKQYAGLEERFCPAKVYEFVDDDKGGKKLQINAQNCLHCKTCSIKMVDEYIDWNVPQGSEGPNYTSM